MRSGGCFLVLGFGGFPLFLAGLRGVLPQIAGDEGFFPGADALVQAVPLGNRVQLLGGKDDFNIRDAGGLLVAVVVGGGGLGSDGGDLFRAGSSFAASFKMICSFVMVLAPFRVVVGVRDDLPAAAGVVGRGRFTVRPC